MTTRPTEKRSRLDPEPIPRRDWLGLGSLWMAEHFRSPVSVVAGSQMPPAPLPEEGIRQFTVHTISASTRGLNSSTRI